MRAMRVHELGQPLTMDDIPLPEPGKGEVRLKIEACGVNFADTLTVQGKYQEKPQLPFAPQNLGFTPPNFDVRTPTFDPYLYYQKPNVPFYGFYRPFI